ncbi:hypothetical protein [Halocatena marina]|uniref:hypothetical protein n=1 Tax=Halocatena marina TaxID=2934937 RepID=UPI00222E9E62|nr:hypothetical protein [Halocatena marina]
MMSQLVIESTGTANTPPTLSVDSWSTDYPCDWIDTGPRISASALHSHRPSIPRGAWLAASSWPVVH